MTKETEPYIAVPPGYIVLSRADYDSIMERLNTVKSNAYDDVKHLNDEIAYLKKVIDEKQDEILTQEETISELRSEKNRIFDKLNMEIAANNDMSEKWDSVTEFLKEKWLLAEYAAWYEDKEDTIDASLQELREPGP